MIEIGKEYIFNYRARKNDAPEEQEFYLLNNGCRCRVIDIWKNMYEVEEVNSHSQFFVYECELDELSNVKGNS